VSLRKARGCLDGKALHQPFAVDMGVKKCAGMGLKLRNRFIGRERDLRLPALHGDAAVLCVDAGDDALRANAAASSAAKAVLTAPVSEKSAEPMMTRLAPASSTWRARSME
jgi:hypothetical protein